MTDYKQLCGDLVDELECWIVYGDEIDIANAHALVDRARAALAQPEPKGPTPQPVPVSERLPGPGDCDAEGMCWWWCAPAERWLHCGIPQPDQASQVHTHWLPASALPLPQPS